jgi:lysine 6-dehydrogenase
MRILVLGLGRMGSAIAYDLIKCREVPEVTVADFDEEKLHQFARKIESEKLSVRRVDVTNRSTLKGIAKGFEVVADALPNKFSTLACETCIKANTNVVSINFDDNMISLAKVAEKAKITFIPGCGVAPGLVHVLAGNAIESLEKVEEVHMMCGGIPQNPKPPLFYQTVFSMESTWMLYTRSPRVIIEGQIKTLPPLSGRSFEVFPEPFGKLERFYTDGLATFLYSDSGKRVRNMYESTIRWPGHLDRVQTLIECGLLKDEPVSIDASKVVPREFLSKLLHPILETEVRDVTIIRVVVSGERGESTVRYVYDAIDYYDEKHDITSMARTTGYTCSIACQMIGLGEINTKGLVPPEEAFRGRLFNKFIKELAERGIYIHKTIQEKALLKC